MGPIGRQLEVIDGFSESVWKSLAVKALRIGWPNGLREAEQRLGKGTMRGLLCVGVYEDIFPAMQDMPAVAELIARRRTARLDYEDLCRYDTHHGRGYSEEFWKRRDIASPTAKLSEYRLRTLSRHLGAPLWRRGLGCIWIWEQLEPIVGGFRDIDSTPWTGMPKPVVDSHTYEGKVARTGYTMLSGDYDTHRTIGQKVRKDGWQKFRAAVHKDLWPRPGGGWEVPQSATQTVEQETFDWVTGKDDE